MSNYEIQGEKWHSYSGNELKAKNLEAEIEELKAENESLFLRANDVAAENARLTEELEWLRQHSTAENETLTDALRQIRTWANAYPLAIFPEPNWTKAAAVLEVGGMTLGAIGASNMRHVLDGVMRIVDGVLAGREGE